MSGATPRATPSTVTFAPAGCECTTSMPVVGVSANSRYCETCPPAGTCSGITRGTPRPRSSRMCEPGGSDDPRRRHAAAHAVDEHLDTGRTRLHDERARARRRGGAGRMKPRGIHAAAEQARQTTAAAISLTRATAAGRRPAGGTARAVGMTGSIDRRSSTARRRLAGSPSLRDASRPGQRATAPPSPVRGEILERLDAFGAIDLGRRVGRGRAGRRRRISSARVGTGAVRSSTARGASFDDGRRARGLRRESTRAVATPRATGADGQRRRRAVDGRRREARRDALGAGGGTIDSVGIAPERRHRSARRCTARRNVSSATGAATYDESLASVSSSAASASGADANARRTSSCSVRPSQLRKPFDSGRSSPIGERSRACISSCGIACGNSSAAIGRPSTSDSAVMPMPLTSAR